ncbi:transcription factor BIM2-like isoform X2 [Iris pallida]|uniref:Transcription factor BIM2-like isoform X2 n=1 Tax=Iris pallida TaxID=29817 RepID=A0AAX6DH19_IRIPA|nr:transcription factor BIM2-like isoform X2 [Iris pallida]
MWMEFQGKKATHDFLSLCNKDSSFLQDQEPRPPHGIYLRTHDFLKPLEKGTEEEVVGPEERPERAGQAQVAHLLPGGIGTFSISRAAGNGLLAAAVKSEEIACVPVPVSVSPHETCSGRKPEARTNAYGSYAAAGPGTAFTLWEASVAAAAKGQWPASFSAARTAITFASRSQPAYDRKPLTESGSRSSRGFGDEEDEDDGFSKREARRGELTVRVDGKSGSDQRASTPRSKHSATEQRRRSKIKDRFQILRELIPHSDQKRDKASFLLEVIEYIRFLQEKTQKYESSYPGWNEDNAKLMPWNSSQVPVDNVADPSQIMKTGPRFMYPGKFDDNSIPVAPAMLSITQNPVESDLSVGVSYKAMENSTGFTNNAAAPSILLQPCSYASVERGTGITQPQPGLISDIDNLASQSQSQWLRPSCPPDCSVSSETLNGQEELTIDEGTISVSTAYSHNLLNTINQALESSGIDLSQANVSVQINLGKRATTRRPTVTTTMSSAKDIDNPLSRNRRVMGHSRVGSSGEESERGAKRRKQES